MSSGIITELLKGKKLRQKESYTFFKGLFQQRVSDQDAKAALLMLARRGETAEEVAGCLQALRELEPPLETGIRGMVDTCGTGGDGSHSINVSTLSAIVVAGAGGHVAKHGNRALSSKTGSSDLMEALGVRLEAPVGQMLKAIREAGIGYFHAPAYHPVFARVQPLRRALKVRTLFNLLGPLVNPCGVRRQVIGVSKPDHVAFLGEVIRRTRPARVLICHSEDGMDELTTSSDSSALLIEGRKMRRMAIKPRKLGFRKASRRDYAGGTALQNKRVALSLLKGKVSGPIRDIVLLNSAAALYVGDLCRSLPEGIRKAAESIDSGAALKSLEQLKIISNMRKR